ncbi:MAG: gliding motility protein GldN [Paludibacteraceae bacterium]|nr:gliding motility protein GldN [Paludibacteraceae bacterium]
MKKLNVIIVLLMLSSVSLMAQHQINSFFNKNGTVRLETQELIDSSDSLASVFHRADDVIWSRVVYRIIDMRYKQNLQLYFPTNADDPQYNNLLKVICLAIIDGMPVYAKPNYVDITPHFEFDPMDKPSMVGMLNNDLNGEIPQEEGGLAGYDQLLINYDSIEDVMTFQTHSFEPYVRNQYKYLLQEIVFFDKHYSRLYTKIIGIAPLFMNSYEVSEDTPIHEALYLSIRFWILYDDLRPYLARQYVIPQANDTKRVTFEQFFAQKLYSSYLIGDSNMYSRMFAQYATKAASGALIDKRRELLTGSGGEEEEEGGEETEEGGEEEGAEEGAEEGGEEGEAEVTPEDTYNKALKARIEKELKREQARVQKELMDFEQDLWEY